MPSPAPLARSSEWATTERDSGAVPPSPRGQRRGGGRWRARGSGSADEIRHFGNYGLHIQHDGLDSVSSEEVTDVAEIAWQPLHSLYIAPAKTAELRKKRGSKGGALANHDSSPPTTRAGARPRQRSRRTVGRRARGEATGAEAALRRALRGRVPHRRREPVFPVNGKCFPSIRPLLL